MSDSDTFGAFFAGFVIGGLAGAAAALLLAPQSGEETRAQLQERGIELQTRAQDAIDEARKQADAVIADVQERSRVILEEQKERLQEGRDLIESKFQQAEAPPEDTAAEAAA